jgi:site-specific recombinase XerC
MQFQAALTGFLVQLDADGRSPHTMGQYRRHVTSLITWLQEHGHPTDVALLSPELLAKFFADPATQTSCRGGRKKASSSNAMRTSIRCFATWLHDSGYVTANPARLLRRARCAAPPPKALHVDEQQRLLQALATASAPAALRDRMLIELLLGAGLRIGSAIAINIEDIDFEHGEVALRSTKGDRPTTTLLPRAVAESLQTFVGELRAGPVFRAGDRRVSLRHMQRRLAQWFGLANITGKSAHSLRHTFATGLLAKTGDIRLVQSALNHASIVSTTIYAGANRDKLREAVGA